MTTRELAKQPSAFVPVAMSLAALTIVILHVTFIGTEPQPDEGTSAHLWQLLMAGQLPVILYFAVKWLARAPKQALAVLAIQLVAGVAAAAPVFILEF